MSLFTRLLAHRSRPRRRRPAPRCADGAVRPRPVARPADHHRRPGLAQAAEVRGVDRDLRVHAGLGLHLPAGLAAHATRRRSRHGRRVRPRGGHDRRPGVARHHQPLQRGDAVRRGRLRRDGARRSSRRRCWPSRWPWRSGGSRSPIPRWAGRCVSASIVTVLGAFTGGLMTQPTAAQIADARATHQMPFSGAHTVGAPDGGPGTAADRLEHAPRRRARAALHRPARVAGAAAVRAARAATRQRSHANRARHRRRRRLRGGVRRAARPGPAAACPPCRSSRTTS